MDKRGSSRAYEQHQWWYSEYHSTVYMHGAFIAKTPLQSSVRQTTRLVVMRTASQCRIRCPFQNLRVTNVVFIVTYYTLPPIESSPSFWMTRSQRSRRRDKGLWYGSRRKHYIQIIITQHNIQRARTGQSMTGYLLDTPQRSALM